MQRIISLVRHGLTGLLAGACLMGFAAGMAQAQGSALTQADTVVADVVFVIGEARNQRGEPIAAQGKVRAGDSIHTGANGHVHLRFIDQAFVSVRPASRLTVEQYVYDPKNAANNRVKFVLEEGTSRLITGKAGQAAKENFRLNTPVAAIGVRGTDFVVHTTADNTRVAVQQGAVVVAPLGAGCAATGLGPCLGELSRQLSGTLQGRYLEIEAQGRPPVLKAPGGAARDPDGLAPPRPEEPSAGASGALPHAAQSQVWWGRWGDASQERGVVAPGRELLGQNELFYIMRSTGRLEFPKADSVSFSLVDSRAYRRISGGAYVPGTVSNASLLVDFGGQTFTTRLDFNQPGRSAEVVQARGKLSDDGRFMVNRAYSNAIISGGLADNGNEAGYVFTKHLADDSSLLGVLRWRR